MDILILSGSRNGFVDGRDGFAKAAEVSLEYSHVQKRILIVNTLSRMHRIVKVTMQSVES